MKLNRWVFVARESTLYLLALSTTGIALVSLYLLFIPGWATWMAIFFFVLGGTCYKAIDRNIARLEDEHKQRIAYAINISTVSFPSPCKDSAFLLSRYAIDGDDFENQLVCENSEYLQYFKLDKDAGVSSVAWSHKQNAAIFESHLEALAVMGLCRQHDQSFAFVIEETFKNRKQLKS